MTEKSGGTLWRAMAAGLMSATVVLVQAAPAAAGASGGPAAVANPSPTPAPAAVARVNGVEISAAEFMRSMQVGAKQKFYHGSVTPEQVAALRDETVDKLVLRRLLIDEAARRKLAANTTEIEATLDGYDKRYANSEQWKKSRDTMLPRLRRELTEQDLVNRIEVAVRSVKPVPAEDVRKFYDSNPALFTEPMQFHVAVMLLKVDASATKEVRNAARAEAKAIHAKLVKGAEFSALAQVHSAHESAAKGGDLGYLHRGMLPEALDNLLTEMKPGQLSAPTDVLEGVALLKLMERREPALRKFDDVRERAEGLLQRERANDAWNSFTKELHRVAKVEVFTEALRQLTDNPGAAPAAATPAKTDSAKSTNDKAWASAPSGPGTKAD